MCGFSITVEPLDGDLLKHRGVKRSRTITREGFIDFHSLPLSSHGKNLEQPLMVTHPGGIKTYLCFNGEIFNYQELDPKAESDLHYLQGLLQKRYSVMEIYAESVKWEGFWAIGIMHNSRLYMFTDWLGKKQLYVNRDLGIASEIKPLIREPFYSWQDYDEGNFNTVNTNFTSVKRVPPGMLCEFKYKEAGNNVGLKELLRIPIGGPSEFSWNGLYSVIDKAVEERLQNRYDGISLLLSSGLDSNIILHHTLKRTRNIDVVTYRSPETPNVIRTCESLGLDLRIVEPDYSEYDEAVKAYECSLDYGSLMPNYQLFKACKNSAVLTGDGSDEFFSGYGRSKEKDTFFYDVFMELPYYHNIRIDRTSMAHTKEARSPLMAYRVLNYITQLPLDVRRQKKILKLLYAGRIPDYVLAYPKTPLRTDMDKAENRIKCLTSHKNQFYEFKYRV